jgi:hypothetical protein
MFRTSQETHDVSTTEPNRLMLCGETVAVCCESRTEHTDTVRTSQGTHRFSTIQPNRLMLCGETAAVCCENRTEHRYSPYLTGDTLRLHYRAQPVNAVWGKQLLFAVRTVRNTDTVCTSQETHHVSTTEPNRLMLHTNLQLKSETDVFQR